MKNTLVDINVYLAKKQQGIVNSLLENNPIIASIPVKAASHGFYNLYSKVDDIQALQEVDYDDELPTVGISFELGKTRLGKLGGKLPMPEDAAKEMGGYDRYAADRIPSIVEKSGNDNEGRIYYNGFLKAAIDNKQAITAGGTTANSQFSMVAVHYDNDSTIGLYNPNAVNEKKLFAIRMLNGGNIGEINVNGKTIVGKMMVISMEFGLQLADPRYVAAIVNIEPKANVSDPDKLDGLPTRKNIEDMLGMVRANASNTVIYAHPTLVGYLAQKFQLAQRIVTNNDNSVRYVLSDWNGIKFISSYNISWGKEPVTSIS